MSGFCTPIWTILDSGIQLALSFEASIKLAITESLPYDIPYNSNIILELHSHVNFIIKNQYFKFSFIWQTFHINDGKMFE